MIERSRLKIILQTAFDIKFCWVMTQAAFATGRITAWFEIIRSNKNRVRGYATHAVDRGAGYGLLKMGKGVFRLPNNRINILLIQQPFFNFFTHQFGSLLKKGIIIIIPDTKFF